MKHHSRHKFHPYRRHWRDWPGWERIAILLPLAVAILVLKACCG